MLRRTSNAVFLAVALLAACKSSSTGPTLTQPFGSYQGTMVGGSVSGVLSLAFPNTASAQYVQVASGIAYSAMTPDAFSITGTFIPTGGAPSVVFTGTYTPTAATPLAMTGPGGWSVTGSWSASGNTLTGVFTGPSGTGRWTVSGGAGAKVFCGTYGTGAGVTSGTGVWNLVWDGGTALLGVASGSSDNLVLSGTLNGTAVNVQYSGGTATGTLNSSTGTGSGSWTSGSSTGGWATSASC